MSARRDPTAGIGAGLVFLLIGIAVLLDELDVWQLRAAIVLPLALIAVGLWFLARSIGGTRRDGEP